MVMPYMMQDNFSSYPTPTAPVPYQEPPSFLGSLRDEIGSMLTRATPGTYEDQIPENVRRQHLNSALLMGGLQGAAKAIQPIVGPPQHGGALALKNVADTAMMQNQLYNNLLKGDVGQLQSKEAEMIKQAQAKAVQDRADAEARRAAAYEYYTMHGNNKNPLIHEGMVGNEPWVLERRVNQDGSVTWIPVMKAKPVAATTANQREKDKRLAKIVDDAKKDWREFEDFIYNQEGTNILANFKNPKYASKIQEKAKAYIRALETVKKLRPDMWPEYESEYNLLTRDLKDVESGAVKGRKVPKSQVK